jgi:hypothetical protein
MMVPERFCVAVCVGCKMRRDSTRKRRPAELRRGCAEKKIKSLRKMLAQIRGMRRATPAWARIAVPGVR